jgi:uncharacterized LabA/DUF88 family protein
MIWMPACTGMTNQMRLTNTTILGIRGHIPSLRHLLHTEPRLLFYIHPMPKRIAIFADVQNIYYTTRQAYGRQFDYRKLWQRISSEGEIISATAYAIHRGDSQQLKFQNALKDIGFTVKLKPYIQRSDGTAKGDWDVGITIDALEIASEVDTIVLLSGDGDFDLLLDKLNEKYGVSTEVYGVPALTAKSLIDSASVYHRIEEDLLL